jgi:pyruvate dehydrogenase E2 component (dihydrolipoamide acetyltransferase)
MAMEVYLPDLGGDMEAATIKTWHFNEGDRVNEGDDLVELQIDHTVFNLPSPCSGVLLEIIVEPGDVAEIGEALATIDEE